MIGQDKPIIIINFKKTREILSTKIPLFIYLILDEENGFCLVSQSKQLQIATENITRYKTEGISLTDFSNTKSENSTTNIVNSNSIKSILKQKPENEVISISLVGNITNKITNLFLTGISFIFKVLKTVSSDYTISFYSSTILGVNCKLSNFSYEEVENTSKVNINLNLVLENNDTTESIDKTNESIVPLNIGETPIL